MDGNQQIPQASTLYCCNICKTKPDQISHLKTHLTTQKHIFKKKCFEQCVYTTFLAISIFHQNKDNEPLRSKKIIDEFEKDTGLQFIQGNRTSHNAMRDWRLSKDRLLDEEFPDTIIPLETSFETEEKYKNSVKQIIETNETIIVTNEENKKGKKYGGNSKQPLLDDETQNLILEIKSNIENYDMDFFINMAIEKQEPYVIALIIYKQNHNYISFKRVEHKIIHQKTNKIMKHWNKCWIYKDIINDDNSNKICDNLRKTISTSIYDMFNEKIKDFTNTSNGYMSLTKMMHKLKLTMFKNEVMKITEQIFTTDIL